MMKGLPYLTLMCFKARYESYRAKDTRTVLINLTDGSHITFASYVNGRLLP